MSMGDFISPTGSNLSPLENSALRVSHEHTDSGLGADQDYAYSSERWVLQYFIYSHKVKKRKIKIYTP